MCQNVAMCGNGLIHLQKVLIKVSQHSQSWRCIRPLLPEYHTNTYAKAAYCISVMHDNEQTLML